MCIRDRDDVVPADRPIQVRDLLVCGSGYGMDASGPTPSAQALRAAGVEAGPDPVTILSLIHISMCIRDSV